jgi:hypothetical protein
MPKPKEPVSVERLAEVFRYDPGTGELRWNMHRSQRFKPGDLAGARTAAGYREVMIDRSHCKVHRVAWALTYGEWPQWPVDHIDGNRSNNAICNLREITESGNSHNVHVPRAHNKTGYLGVWQVAKNQRFVAEIRSNGVKHHIGYFDTAEEAHAAYLKKKKELRPDVYA